MDANQAGNAVAYLQQIIGQQVQTYATRAGIGNLPVNLVARVVFNPNLKSEWSPQ